MHKERQSFFLFIVNSDLILDTGMLLMQSISETVFVAEEFDLGGEQAERNFRKSQGGIKIHEVTPLLATNKNLVSLALKADYLSRKERERSCKLAGNTESFYRYEQISDSITYGDPMPKMWKGSIPH